MPFMDLQTSWIWEVREAVDENLSYQRKYGAWTVEGDGCG